MSSNNLESLFRNLRLTLVLDHVRLPYNKVLRTLVHNTKIRLMYGMVLLTNTMRMEEIFSLDSEALMLMFPSFKFNQVLAPAH